jgi:hypothetical protein
VRGKTNMGNQLCTAVDNQNRSAHDLL